MSDFTSSSISLSSSPSMLRLLVRTKKRILFEGLWILLTASLAQAGTVLHNHVLIHPPPSNALYPSGTYIVWAPILLILVVCVFVTVLSLTIVRHQKTEEALRKSEQKFRALFDNAQDTVFIHDLEGHILDANRTACLRLGYSHDEFLRMTPEDVDVPEMAIKVPERLEMLQKKGHALFETSHRHRDGSAYPVEVSSMLFEHGGKMLVCSFCRDIMERKRAEMELAQHRDQLEKLVRERTAELEKEIAERKAALAEKEVLLREVHHRVKNNLNTIVNILYFQTKTLEDKKALAAFQDSQNRIHSMARVHEHLYHSASLAQVNMANYFRELTTDLQQTFARSDIAIHINAMKESLDIDRAIPCGLIVNELITNALKYAFPEDTTKPKKEVAVQLTTQANQHILEVRDNGVGLPAGMNVGNTTSLGLRLVSMLTRQLKGQLTVDTATTQGTKFTLTFPVETTGSSNGKN